MTDKHTPGPWHLGMDEDGKYFALAGGNESRTKSIMIARFDGGSNKGRSVDEANANARLMAAAPDLLEALEQVERWPGFIPKEIMRSVMAAIAKAKGDS